MVWPYALKPFSEQFNVLNVNYGITTIENIAGKTTYITPKNHNIWGCPDYVLDTILQVDLSKISK